MVDTIINFKDGSFRAKIWKILTFLKTKLAIYWRIIQLSVASLEVGDSVVTTNDVVMRPSLTPQVCKNWAFLCVTVIVYTSGMNLQSLHKDAVLREGFKRNLLLEGGLDAKWCYLWETCEVMSCLKNVRN